MAGLKMANLFQRHNYDYKLLEGSKTLGGRTKSITFNGHILDIGGSMIHEAHVELNKMIKEYKLKVVNYKEDGKSRVLFKGKYTDVWNLPTEVLT